VSAELVTLEEVKEWLDLPREETRHDRLLEQLTARVEELLEQAKRRSFAAAGTASATVTVDGTGQSWLWLERPIGTLTSVKIGVDVAAPDAVLTPGPRVVVFQGRRLARQDGGIFPRGVANVHVDYVAASSLTDAAKQAVLDAVALAYRQRGSEDATSENAGSFAHGLRDSFEQLPSWQALPGRPVLA